MNWKGYCLDAAEVFDAWRVVPRIILFGYGAWAIKVVGLVLDWYMTLPFAERSFEASGLAGVVITAVTGLATLAIKLYVQSGREWGTTTPTGQTTINTTVGTP